MVPAMAGRHRPALVIGLIPQIHSRDFEIDLLLRELAKQRIGFLLFLERLLEERCCILQAELRRPGLQGAIARHLIVLDCLAAGQEPRVESLAPQRCSNHNRMRAREFRCIRPICRSRSSWTPARAGAQPLFAGTRRGVARFAPQAELRSMTMRALIALMVIVYLVGVGVALSPTIRAKWNNALTSDLAASVGQDLPYALTWPARVYAA